MIKLTMNGLAAGCTPIAAVGRRNMLWLAGMPPTPPPAIVAAQGVGAGTGIFHIDCGMPAAVFSIGAATAPMGTLHWMGDGVAGKLGEGELIEPPPVFI